MIQRSAEEDIKIITNSRSNEITHRHHDLTQVAEWFPDFEYTDFKTAIEQTVREFSH